MQLLGRFLVIACLLTPFLVLICVAEPQGALLRAEGKVAISVQNTYPDKTFHLRESHEEEEGEDHHGEEEDDDHDGHDHGEEEDDDHDGHDHGEEEGDDHDGHDHGEEGDDHDGHDHGEEGDDHDGHDHGDDHDGHDHGEEESEGLSGSKLWGFAILGALVTAAMSLLGATIASFHPSFGKDVATRAYLNSFSVGIMMGLIFVHLVPEGLELSGAKAHDWKPPLGFLIGFFVAFFVHHFTITIGARHCGGVVPLPPPADSTIETASRAMPQGLTYATNSSYPPSAVPAAIPWAGQHGLYYSNPGMQQPHLGQPYVGQYGPGPGWPGQMVPIVGSAFGNKEGSVGGASGSESSGKLAEVELFPTLENAEASHYTTMGLTMAQWSVITNISLGDFLCNFVDGLVIAAAFWECGTTKGFLVSIAVCLHELPQEISDFLLLRRSGLSVAMALCANVIISIAAILGVMVFMAILGGSEDANVENAGYVLSASSGFLTFVAVGLLPAITAVRETQQVLTSWFLVLLGPVIMFLLLLWHPECGHEGHDH